MSAATAADAGAAPPKGKKKLFIIIGAVVAVLVLGGAGAVLMLKKKAAAQADEEVAAEADEAAAAKAPRREMKSPPVFVPLDAFTVNLADKEADRYAQIGITLELDGSATEAELKTFMPAVRNNVLMLLAHKTAVELLERDGKERLAREVAREVSRGLGFEVPPLAAAPNAPNAPAAPEDADEDAAAAKKPRRKPAAEPVLPVTAVYFSTFIIQ